MISFFKLIIYTPIYNGLVFLIDILPGADVGLAVILITVLVKLLLFPISFKAYSTQIAMRKFNDEINAIKNKLKNNKNKQAEAIMAFYKEKKINPFASLIVLFIQIPVVLSLFYVFARGGFPVLHQELLYSFVGNPETINTLFLGFFEVGGKSIILAVLVGLTQFFQMKIAMPQMPVKKTDGSFKDNMARGFQFQMRYIMPIFISFVAYGISVAVCLYWITSNVFAIGQELYLRKKFSKNNPTETKTTETVPIESKNQ